MSQPSAITRTRCLVVSKAGDQVSRQIETQKLDGLGDDCVRVRVQYSSMNYKDALCSNGHPGIAKTLPLVPGIDAAGLVEADHSDQFKLGQAVMIFHADFGTQRNGGYSQFVDVPADWVYPLPLGMSLRDCMILGTAGFTAAQCVDELIKHEIHPQTGDVVVTGATGGVGICAVKLLAKLGYRVFAVTGKPERAEWLMELGATKVIGRDEVDDVTKRPLLTGRWAGAVDTVGGNILATILRSTAPQGCVTACGLVAGVDLPLTVYPFILRGITLQGVDTAGISREYRSSLWNKLSNEWAIEDLDSLAIEVDLEGLLEKFETILDGQIAGRVVVNMQS